MCITLTQKTPSLEIKDGNHIPQIGLGTYRLKGEECRRAVRIALKKGYNHIDTAEMYENEPEIRKEIEGINRSNLFITSKVRPTNLYYEDVLKACNSSLKRLGTSYVDLYLIHWPNEAVPIGETLQAMEKLHEEGKAKSIGVSNFTIQQTKKAMKVSEVPITANQVEFHPWLYQKELLEFCRKHDIVLIAYTPLARTKVFKEEVIQRLADKHEKTPAQIVLRWEIQRGVVTIPKSSSEKHIQENLQILDWKLDSEDTKRIDEIPVEKRLVNSHYASF